MTSWALGLLIATVAAIVVGLIIGSSRFLRRATHTTIEFLRPIPSVALIPLAVLIFGTSIESTLLLVVYASFWQVLLQLLYGIADVDAVANDTAKSYGLGRLARVRYVIWPTALPYLMTGLRLAAAVALILAITAELIIGTPGLGKQIALTQSGGAISSMYALVLATGMIGVLINLAARVVEKRVLSWHPSVRGEVVL
jgi:ABC-type nitrate/sulfonate/bicarbonate transport system permease component